MLDGHSFSVDEEVWFEVELSPFVILSSPVELEFSSAADFPKNDPIPRV